ncbi:MAG: hypothetical protein ACK5B9_16650 [Flavobacteriia bacterium]
MGSGKKTVERMKIKPFLIIFIFIVSACISEPKKKEEIVFVNFDVKKVENILGKEEYWNIYKILNDTVEKKIKDGHIIDHIGEKRILDSTFLLNSKKDKLIAFWILYGDKEVDGGYSYFKGQKINNKWYFYEDIFQSMGEKSSYSEIHDLILKKSSAYLIQKKNIFFINDNIFYKEFDRYEEDAKKANYPLNRLEKSRYFITNMMREFYQDKMLHEIYKPRDFALSYDKSKRELTITCPIKKWNEFPIDYQVNWYYNNYKPRANSSQFVPMSQNESSCVIKNVKANDDVYFLFSFAGKEWVEGVGLVYYHYKLSNGKAKFIGLVPDEDDIRTYDAPRQDSIRKVWQKRIDERLGKNYGK